MKHKLFIFALLATVGFFNPMGVLSDQVQKLLFYISVLFCFIVANNSNISLQRYDYPRKSYTVLLLGIIISIFMASAFHMQSFKTSIVATLPFIFSFSFFYALMKLNIQSDKILKIYAIVCLLSSIVYFTNLITFPNPVFGGEIDEDLSRGMQRIPVKFLEVFVLLLLYSINSWLIEKKKKWIYYIVILSVMIILSVTRQVILYAGVLSVIFIFKDISYFKKFLLCASIVIVVVYVLPLIPIYNEMVELSEMQAAENEDEDNIRIQAWRYYTDENQTNNITRLFGNGVPSLGNSMWGQMFDSETEDNGCYYADVSWAGFYYLFGIFSTCALLILLIKAMMKKKKANKRYLTYWFAFMILYGIAAGPFVYFYQIFNLMIGLYLVYTPDEDSNSNIKLQ